MNVLRIVPTPLDADSPSRTQGTKIYTQSGELVEGVTGVTLRADVNSHWKASIECAVQVDGEIVAEVTDLGDTFRRFKLATPKGEECPVQDVNDAEPE